jgi:hypothetical protein
MKALKSPLQLFKFDYLRQSPALRPDPVFVVGMHRSGTSALSGALEQLGLTVGRTVMPPNAGMGNPRGYYENLSLTELHDRFLESIGSSWLDYKPLTHGQANGLAAHRFRLELLRLLTDEFAGGRPLIKDPRLCRLISVWLPVIRDHFPDAGFILPIRHPVEVACSLRQRDRMPLDRGVALWTVHVLEAEKTTRGLRRAFSTYDELLNSPLDVVSRVAANLGLTVNGAATAVACQIDPALRHHSRLSWPTGLPLEDLTLSIHQALVSAGPGLEQRLDSLREQYYSRMCWRN